MNRSLVFVGETKQQQTRSIGGFQVVHHPTSESSEGETTSNKQIQEEKEPITPAYCSVNSSARVGRYEYQADLTPTHRLVKKKKKIRSEERLQRFWFG